MTPRAVAALENLQRITRHSGAGKLLQTAESAICGRLRECGLAATRELRRGRSRMAHSKQRDLAQIVGERIEVEAAKRLELGMRGATRAHEVRMVGIREAV